MGRSTPPRGRWGWAFEFEFPQRPFCVPLCGDAKLRQVWHHFDPLFPLNSTLLLPFSPFIPSTRILPLLSLLSPEKHRFHGRQNHHSVRCVRVHLQAQRRAFSGQHSISKPCCRAGSNAHRHIAPSNHAGVREEDGAERRR